MADQPELGKKIKIWNSRYALTAGLIEQEGEVRGDGLIRIPATTTATTMSYYLHGEGKQWHRTREEAVKRAETLRANKIAALNRQIKKLKALKF